MRTETKIISVAALIAGLSSAAVAEVNSVVEPLPDAARSSLAAQAGDVTTVTTFTTEVPRAASNNSLSTQAGDTGATAISSTIDSGDIPASFWSSSAARGLDMNDLRSRESISSRDGSDAWTNAAVDLNSAKVQSALDAAGYNKDDIVRVETRADGGLTLVVTR